MPNDIAVIETADAPMPNRYPAAPQPRPSIGRIVHLKLAQWHVDAIRQQREATGEQGMPVEVGDIVPLLITRVDTDFCINGRVFLDGPDLIWVIGVTRTDDGEWHEGDWAWPERV